MFEGCSHRSTTSILTEPPYHAHPPTITDVRSVQKKEEQDSEDELLRAEGQTSEERRGAPAGDGRVTVVLPIVQPTS
ncbi:hypothetical protein ANCCAN_06099 [Ancylostoma caninum]|uniref:Uncharacterized protein n=1 Tax=Ancylostoma caninum TaxID=29170 RepID=A0A368GTR8_ANCCA|nr:hypothetical protein ANCCAN_06099 [Ancylostoma caninum]